MKNVFVVLSLVSISLSAFAHPQGSDPLTSIGIGTKLTINQPLNFPPQTTALYFYSEYDSEGFNTQCSLKLPSAVNFDRSVSGTLTVIRTEFSGLSPAIGASSLLTKTEKGNILKITCLQANQVGIMVSPSSKTTSLEKAEAVLNPILYIQLAAPESF